MDSTAAMLSQLERVVFQLDVEVAQMVESITKLEDISEQLNALDVASLTNAMKNK